MNKTTPCLIVNINCHLQIRIYYYFAIEAFGEKNNAKTDIIIDCPCRIT